MYRRLSFLVSIALLILAMALSSAAKSVKPDLPGMPKEINGGKPVTITCADLGNLTDATDVGTKAGIDVAKAFKERYPNVTLKPWSFLKIPGGGSDSRDNQTLMSMAAGIAPDVMMTNFRQSDTYISQGFLRPLDDYVAKWRSTSKGDEEFRKVFGIKKGVDIDKVPPDDRPALVQVAYRVGPDGKYHWYAVPPDTLVLVLFRLKDKLNAAGVNAEKPPKDWDDFYDQCVQVCDPRPEKDVYAYMMSTTWFMTYMLWSTGSEILKPVKPNSPEWEAKYDDDGAVRAFQFSWKLQKGPWAICPTCGKHWAIPYHVNTGDFISKTATCPNGHSFDVKDLEFNKKMLFRGVCTDDINKYYNSRVVFTISYMGNLNMIYGTVDPTITGLSRVPADPITGNSMAEINASMLAVNGSLRDKAKIEAAWAYIHYRASDEAKAIWTKLYAESGFAKYLNPSWLRQFHYEEYLREINPEWEKTFKEAFENSRPEPYGKNAQQIYNEMDLAWGEIKLLKGPDPAKVKSILQKNVIATNERLFGTITPAEKQRRDRYALLFVIVTAILFVMLFRYTMAAYGHALSSENVRTKAAMRQVLVAWVIMLPAILAVLLFQYVPLFRGSAIAFQDYKILLGYKWVGLSNFGQVLFSEAGGSVFKNEFWSSLKHTLEFSGLTMGLGFFAPIILAIILHEIPKGSLFFRVIYFLPSVTTGIVVMLLWMQMYDPQVSGTLNEIFSWFHIKGGTFLGIHINEYRIPTQQFLDDPKLAMFWVVLPMVWMGLGPGCIIYLACLQQIPTEYYEAADVDGAGIFSKLKRITLPFLKPLLIINFVGAFVASMRSFEPIMIMTQGGPAGKTQVLGFTLFQNSFVYLKYGFATAMGWMLAALLIGFTMFQLRYLSKVQFKLAKSDD